MITQKRSFLCVGLDPDLSKLPSQFPQNIVGIRDFLKIVVENTEEFAVAYKVNAAFFEALGIEGWRLMDEVANFLPTSCYLIADAKRGDIGNTGEKYAQAFLENMPFDSITFSPYMGEDSVAPFIQNPSKSAFILALTSNSGASDFQLLNFDGKRLFEHVIAKGEEWSKKYPGTVGYVMGATRPEYLSDARKIAEEAFLLVPGVGAQGGTLEEVARCAGNKNFIVNSSRQILFPSLENDSFENAVSRQAKKLFESMQKYF